MTDRAEPGPGVASTPEVVGLVPAAGEGSRVAPLPCSKEVFPVGFAPGEAGGRGRVRVACESLLDGMRAAGAETAYVVLREGKWDIPAFLGEGSKVGLRLAYVVTGPTRGVPATLDRAYPFLRSKRILCGFPDILMAPPDVFGPLLERLEEAGADLALALFPDPDPRLEDLVEIDAEGRVTALQVKPGPAGSSWSWAAAAWGPAFTELLHAYADRAACDGATRGDGHLGHAVQVALAAGLDVRAVPFPEGSYRDIGTPAALRRLIEGGEGGSEYG